jgi:type III secretion system FlhB-like substrate exporter
MARGKRFTAEQIITKLREAEIYLGQGKTVKEACRMLQMSEQTYSQITTVRNVHN